MSDDRRLLRSIIRKVHPDLFESSPLQRNDNSEALKLLNQYVDLLSAGSDPPSEEVSFWVKGDFGLDRIVAPLDGSLGKLYIAFGLITEEEWALRADDHAKPQIEDVNFLQWLRDTIATAVESADEHERLKKLVRELKAVTERKHKLTAAKVSDTYSTSIPDLKRQLECLRVLDAHLLLAEEEGSVQQLKGLQLRLYHPDNAPTQTYSWTGPNGHVRLRASMMTAHIGNDGTLHVVADRSSIASQMSSLDLGRARTLTQVHTFWSRRQKELLPSLQMLLGVKSILSDNKSIKTQQKFVLWAGSILSSRAKFESNLSGRQFNFSILIHCDPLAPLVDYLASSSILQVRWDSSPAMVLEFLISEQAEEANARVENLNSAKDEEAHLLAQVKAVFGAKHVIRVCSSEDKPRAMAAARKLIAEADLIKQQVDLRDASIAIDDCYQIWESGFVSIPFAFEVKDLSPKLAALLSGSPEPNTSPLEDEPDDIHSPDTDLPDSLTDDAIGRYSQDPTLAGERDDSPPPPFIQEHPAAPMSHTEPCVELMPPPQRATMPADSRNPYPPGMSAASHHVQHVTRLQPCPRSVTRQRPRIPRHGLNTPRGVVLRI